MKVAQYEDLFIWDYSNQGDLNSKSTLCHVQHPFYYAVVCAVDTHVNSPNIYMSQKSVAFAFSVCV